VQLDRVRQTHQLFIRVHNETLSVAAMRVSNPDRSAVQDSTLGEFAIIHDRQRVDATRIKL
jgi:hypothetical protein